MPVGKFPEELTYWAPAVSNEFGVNSYEDPLFIKGRWQDRAELVRTSRGDEITTQAVVFIDQEIGSKGYLARGRIEEEEPTPEAIEVKQVAISHNMRYSEKEVRVYL